MNTLGWGEADRVMGLSLGCFSEGIIHPEPIDADDSLSVWRWRRRPFLGVNVVILRILRFLT